MAVRASSAASAFEGVHTAIEVAQVGSGRLPLQCQVVNATWDVWVQPRLATKSLSQLAAERKGQARPLSSHVSIALHSFCIAFSCDSQAGQVALQVLAAMQRGAVFPQLGVNKLRRRRDVHLPLQCCHECLLHQHAVARCLAAPAARQRCFITSVPRGSMVARELQRSIVSCGSAISASEANGQWRHAIELLDLSSQLHLRCLR